MARGDHIRVFRDFYWHHGIDCGDGTVIHYTGTPANMHEAEVERADLEDFARGADVEVVTYDVALSRDETLERARSRLGEQSYNPAFNNCEHFAIWCRAGEHRSEQVEMVANAASHLHKAADVAKSVGESFYNPSTSETSGAETSGGQSVARMFTERSVEPYTGDGVDRTLTVGKEGSLHSKNPETNQSIPGAQMTDEADMLGIANLGVGIANLAVGAYNAYQIHQTQDEVQKRARETQRTVRREGQKTRDEVQKKAKETQRTVRREGQKTRDEIRDVKQALARGFSEVQSVLEYQNGLLHTIEEVQQSHGRKLDAIMQGLLEGFESVEEHIRSVTRKRRNDTYLEKLNALHIAKEDIAEALKYDEPSETELQKLERRAEDLRSWVEARLNQSDLHLLGRQPLVFAEVEARVSRIDAQMFRDPDRYRKRVPGRFDEMRRDVRREVERLHKDSSPWEVGTILRDYVRNYGTLHRSLAQSRDLIDGTDTYERHVASLSDSDGPPSSDDDGEMLAEEGYFISPWSNPLPTPPESESHETLDAPVELKTLDDYEWLVQAFDLDRSDFDVHEVMSLPADVLAERLGAEEVFGDLSTLKALAMPETWARYRRAVEEEFDLRPEVRLSEVNLFSERPDDMDPNKPDISLETHAQIFNLKRYFKVSEVFLRQNHDSEYLVVIDYLFNEKYRIHIDLEKGDANVKLFKNYKPMGTTRTKIEGGTLEFEIYNSVDGEQMSFKISNKGEDIEVNGNTTGTKITEIYRV